MRTNDTLNLTLPNKMAYLDFAQMFVVEAAKLHGFKDKQLNQIALAVEESVSNVMKHTYDAEENRTFDIHCKLTPKGIEIILKEKGMPFDPSRVKSYQVTTNIEEASADGLGMFLMKNLMDEYTFNNLGIEGKETIMAKHFPDYQERTEIIDSFVEEKAEPEVIKEKLDYSIRGMVDSEAVEISRCAYKSHGYSFFDEHIYYPDKLVELNNDGTMISAVAVTKDNVFMGHGCFLFQYPEDKIAELTFVFVNVEYRGQGALNRILEYLFAAPSKRELKGVYAYAVANHPFTQKAMIRYGILDCGILLATSPGSWKFKGISDDTTQRISVVLSFRYLIEPSAKTLYCPPQHKEFINKLYDYIGNKVNTYAIAPSIEQLELVDESVIDESVNDLESCGEIHIKKFGKDIVKRIRKITRKMCVEQTACINLFLNLEDAGTYYFTKELEKLGYFFAGILPESKIGEALILQYLNNVDLDYSKITAYSDVAKEILEYIKKNDPNIID